MAQEPHGQHDENGRRRAQEDQQRQAEERGAQTAQRDHTPRQEEAHAREERERQTRGRRAAPAVDEQAEQRRREAMAAASIGGQVILDYNERGSLGARGGAGGDIVENTMVRDEYLVDLGLDPVSPVGPPPSPEVLAARRKREEEAAREAAEGPQQSPKATRASSLAADLDVPLNPPNRERERAG